LKKMPGRAASTKNVCEAGVARVFFGARPPHQPRAVLLC